MSIIQKNEIKEVLNNYYVSLEECLKEIKEVSALYEANKTTAENILITNRLDSYSDILSKVKSYFVSVETLIETNQKDELFQLCKKILEVSSFIIGDADELHQVIVGNYTPPEIDKNIFH